MLKRIYIFLIIQQLIIGKTYADADLFDCLIHETDHSFFKYNKDTNTVVEYTHIYGEGDPQYCINIVVPEYFIIDDIEYPSTYINEDCFSTVPSITSIEFQDTLVSIGTNCFYNCNELENIILPKSVSIIENSPIVSCNNLTNITVHPDNPTFLSENGVLYNKDKTSLIVYPSNKSDDTFLIEESVIEIKNKAFNNCNNLLFLKIASPAPFTIFLWKFYKL